MKDMLKLFGALVAACAVLVGMSAAGYYLLIRIHNDDLRLAGIIALGVSMVFAVIVMAAWEDRNDL